MDPLDGSQLGDIPTRRMRVKVLYSFDAENKTNCLARLPSILDVPAVPIDDQSCVGVIELQRCIEAIVTASPEIFSTLENGDFIIYAHDYSEYDTPLVGQGRLSAILSSMSSSPHRNKSMITGRVCKNLPALFSNGVKETLEVKLRLTPVSRPSVKELAKDAEAVRSTSPATSAGFDPNAWNASMQQHASDFSNFEALSSGGKDDSTALFQDVFGLESDGVLGSGVVSGASGVGAPRTPTDTAFAINPAFSGHSHSAPGSRSNTPSLATDSCGQNEMLRHESFSGKLQSASEQSRPSSRASVGHEVNSSCHWRQPSALSQSHLPLQTPIEEFYNEDGQSRKRAKVTQTDWRGRSSFGAKSADLRVTAATASSMHMFRPIAKRPSAPGSNLEPPPRVPTPVPQRTRMPSQHLQQPRNARSMLRQASTIDLDFMSDAEMMSDVTMSSPEGSSPNNSITAEGTPLDIPSSPPIISSYEQAPPSSPGLPALPKSRMADSGYMSEPNSFNSNVMQTLEEDDNHSPDFEEPVEGAPFDALDDQQDSLVKIERSSAEILSPRFVDSHHTSEAGFQMDNVRMEIPGDMKQLPQRVLLNLPPGRRNQGAPKPILARKPTIADLPVAIQEKVVRPDTLQSRRSSLALPPRLMPAQTLQSQASVPPVPEKQKRLPLQRSQTSATMSEIGSPAPSDTEGRPRGNARSGSAAPRRKVIEQRLQESLAKGEMPEYCTHCGAIETPTWRKLYVKEVDGKPSPLDSVEGEGETIGVQSLESELSTGEVTKFVVRKMMKRTKDCQPGVGFKAVLVCNPCGLWFNKTREMRPSDKWHKTSTRRRRKQRVDDEIATDGIEPDSEAFFTDQFIPECPADVSNNSGGIGQSINHDAPSTGGFMQRSRTNSTSALATRRASTGSETGDTQDQTSSARELRSDPAHGSQDIPIELDLTPNPTRRLLFPSPRQAGETKSLDNGDLPPRDPLETGERALKRVSLNKTITSPDQNVFNVFDAFTNGKENVAPSGDGAGDGDALSYLFDGSPFKTPQRKTPGKKTPLSGQLKTPTQSTRKRKAMTPNQNATNNANMNVNDFMTSPSLSRYYLRLTPSRLDRTPSERTQSSGIRAANHDMTPFSRHLAEMLNSTAGTNEAAFTSPTRPYDFSDLPTFTTPGRELNWKEFDEILSSEFAPYEGTMDLPDMNAVGKKV